MAGTAPYAECSVRRTPSRLRPYPNRRPPGGPCSAPQNTGRRRRRSRGRLLPRVRCAREDGWVRRPGELGRPARHGPRWARRPDRAKTSNPGVGSRGLAENSTRPRGPPGGAMPPGTLTTRPSPAAPGPSSIPPDRSLVHGPIGPVPLRRWCRHVGHHHRRPCSAAWVGYVHRRFRWRGGPVGWIVDLDRTAGDAL